MNSLIWTFLLSLLPFGELRLGIPFGLASGNNFLIVYIVSVLGNMLVIPLVYFFLNFLHHHLMEIGLYERTFNKYLDKARKKIEHKLDGWKYYVLFVFVAIPLPGTGVYTGTLIAWFFEFEKKKSFIAISLGVICAGLIVMLVSLGLINGFKYFF